MSEAIDRAVQLLKDRIAEIEEEATALRRGLIGLDVAPAKSSPKAARPPKRRRRKKRAKKGQRLEEVSSILRANPKAKTADIARQIGISGNQVSGLRKRLEKKAPKAQKKQLTKKVAPKASRSPKKASAKSGTKKGVKGKAKRKKPSKKRQMQNAPTSKTGTKGNAATRV